MERKLDPIYVSRLSTPREALSTVFGTEKSELSLFYLTWAAWRGWAGRIGCNRHGNVSFQLMFYNATEACRNKILAMLLHPPSNHHFQPQMDRPTPRQHRTKYAPLQQAGQEGVPVSMKHMVPSRYDISVYQKPCVSEICLTAEAFR